MRLRALLPPFAAVGNPVDLTPLVAPERIREAVRVVLEQEAVAGAVAVDVGLDVPAFADGLVAAMEATGKPVVAFAADAPAVIGRLRSAGVPVLPSPERAVRAWRALWAGRPGPMPAPPTPRTLPDEVRRALDTLRGPLPYRLARRALEAYGVRFCREEVVASAEAAVAAAGRLGYPVVLKAHVPGTLHKTEAGAVRVGLGDPGAVRAAFAALAERTGAGEFLVQEQVGPGVELLVGARRDEVFGPVVGVGIGGLFAEVIQDVSFRLAPLDEAEARAMLREGTRRRLLAGPRGLPACEDAPLACLAVTVGEFICAEPRVQEVDLNPVIAAGAHAVAVDALVVVGDAP